MKREYMEAPILDLVEQRVDPTWEPVGVVPYPAGSRVLLTRVVQEPKPESAHKPPPDQKKRRSPRGKKGVADG